VADVVAKRLVACVQGHDHEHLSVLVLEHGRQVLGKVRSLPNGESRALSDLHLQMDLLKEVAHG
jgi:hypothetical protein